MRQGVAHGERAAERLAEQRHAAAVGDQPADGRVHPGHEAFHPVDVVGQAQRRDAIAARERRDLPVEEQAGAVQPGQEDEGLAVAGDGQCGHDGSQRAQRRFRHGSVTARFRRPTLVLAANVGSGSS
jgi:hypothetical protein